MTLTTSHPRRTMADRLRRAARRARPLTFVAVLAFASTAAAAPQPPDLVADAPGPSKQPQIYDNGSQRLLMRLDGFVHNSGDGALEIRGSGPSNDSMTNVVQRIYDSAGGFVDHPSGARLWFETTDGHDHWHLMDAMRYSLWSADRSVEVAPAQKVGFCLLDSQRIEANGPVSGAYPVPNGNFCGRGDPNRPEVVMGVSAGWRDIYNSSLPFQWVDISDTQPGSYWLRADADPDGVIQERNETNVGTYAVAPSIVNGYLAQPVDAGSVPAVGSSAIDLAATEFDDPFPGSPGAPQFEIVSPPAAGSLDKPTGQWFSGSQVHFTPSPGQSGPVAFTFAARDSTSQFPLHPPAAGVTFSVAGLPGPGPGPPPVALAISGAPQTVRTSSTTQLQATGADASSGVSWRVNAIAGGNATVGTLSLDGIYRAPAKPPPGGVVTIGARSISGATATVSVRIVQAPEPTAAPSSAASLPLHGLLSRLALARQRRTLIAQVVPGRQGRLRFVARRGKQQIATCSMIAQAHVTSVCSMKLSRTVAPDPFICKVPKTRGMKLPGVRVTVTLSYGGRHRATRSARTR
jgi:Lysyl oxidase